jgi:glucose-1-phosphatase
MVDIKKIKNILFDLGGVILDIDFENTSKAFRKMGLKNFEDLYAQCLNNDLFIKLETGLVSPDNFRKEIKKMSDKPISDNEIDDAWNSMIIGFPPENIRLLMKLKGTFKTFLISNTNKIHFQFYNRMLIEKHGVAGISDLFMKDYYSHNTGLRKPDKDFFNLVLNENKLQPSETLFIDDTMINIESAQSLGINTFLFTGERPLCHIFESGTSA